MSDEIDAVRRSALTFRLGTLQVPASRAGAMARSLHPPVARGRAIRLLLTSYFFLFAVMGLFFVWLFGLPWNSPAWVVFWLAVLSAHVWIPLFDRMPSQREAQAQPALYLHRGIQALRHAAAKGDNRLAPVVARSADETHEESADGSVTGRFQRMYGTPNAVALAVIVVVVLGLAFSFIMPDYTLFHGLDSTLRTILTACGALLLIEGLYISVLGFQGLRPIEMSADEQGVQWQEPTLWFARRNLRAPWQDVRAFTTFRASKDGKLADVDEIYLLESEKHAVAWKITPKTPPSIRETHERFVRMANEHMQLRDITAALRNLLESPETRSYEYAIAMLSDPTPIPPSVRAALIPQARQSRVQSVYLIVSMVLLTLLVAAGLLLQTGVIPPVVPF
jgi:hypothetical protein